MGDIFAQKLAIYFHDPVDKPFILMKGMSHKNRAKHLASTLDIVADTGHPADWIAAAMERAFLPWGPGKEKYPIDFSENPLILHPLSGKPLPGLKKISPQALQKIPEKVEKLFQATGETIKNWEPKRKFLYLWRNLPSLLQKELSDIPGEIIHFLPADTRIPDHSIWEHLKISSACFQTGVYQGHLFYHHSLFLFTLGPVQSFIQQARKTQDSFWSSFLLSYLTWVALEVVVDLYGPDSVIFPDLMEQPFMDAYLKNHNIPVEEPSPLQYPTLPNRFLCILPLAKEEEIRDFAKKLEEAVHSEVHAMQEHLQSLWGKNENIPQQLQGFPAIYWSALPWFQESNGSLKGIEELKFLMEEGDSTHPVSINYWKSLNKLNPPHQSFHIGTYYPLLHRAVEKLLSARKNIRIFTQSIEVGRKCSLCGERNVVYFRGEKTPPYAYGAVRIQNPKIPLQHLAERESLCSLCALKRNLPNYLQEVYKEKTLKKISFPSVAEVAQKPLIDALNQKKDPHFQEWKELLKKTLGYPDAQLLYEENLREDYILKNYGKEKVKACANDLERLQKLQKEIVKKAKDEGIPQTKYYAVFVMDGDSMGKWLSGEKAPKFPAIYHPQVWKNLPHDFKKILTEKKRPMTPALHAFISRTLKDYALHIVPSIIQKHQGTVVYAGGDDVLAFLPLHNLWDCLIELRAAFSGHLDEEQKPCLHQEVSGFMTFDKKGLITLGPQASASGGLAIAHYKTPLGAVIQGARRMEGKAKNMPEKDALGIALWKHSGEHIEVVIPWRAPDQPQGFWGCIKPVTEELKKGKQSIDKGFSDTFIRRGSTLPLDPKRHGGLFWAEMQRLAKRSFKGNKEKAGKVSQDLIQHLQEFYNVLYEKEKKKSMPQLEKVTQDFFNFLFILLFYLREVT